MYRLIINNEIKHNVLLNALSVRVEYLRNERYKMVLREANKNDIAIIDKQILAAAEMYADVDRMRYK